MNQTDKFFGNYLGIVTKTNDPEGRGRVKVYVPHISATVYEKWNAVPEDKVFKFPGINLNSKIMDIKEVLDKVLPWAEIAAPLIGGGTQGRFAGPNSCEDPNEPQKQVPTGPDPNITDATAGAGAGAGADATNPGIQDITNQNGVIGTLRDRTETPVAMVFHYTEGTTLDGAISSMNQNGLGATYYISPNGTISQATPSNLIANHMLPWNSSQNTNGYGPPGLYNSNTIGIEVVTPNGSSVTQAQINASNQLANYLHNTYGINQVYSHDETNPGHRTEGEGQVLADSVRSNGIGDGSNLTNAQQKEIQDNNPQKVAAAQSKNEDACQPKNTGTGSDGNFKIPPLEQTSSGSGGDSTVFGLNMDGTPDQTDVGRLSEPHTGSGGANLLDPNLHGVALSPSQAQYYFGMTPQQAAQTHQQILVFNPTNGQSTLANVVDTGPERGLGGGIVEATPDVFRSLNAGPGDNLVFVDSSGNDPANSVLPSSTEKPAALVAATQPHDGFNNTKENPNTRANSHTHEYAASPYSNVAKGVFSTPNVGAHVWCFFQEGDPMKPVIWALAFNNSDYASIKKSGSLQANDKRLSSENPNDNPDIQGTTDRYRGIYVHNERGGTFEIVNTEGIESMSLIGYHGNNIRIGEHLSMYAANNDQKLVARDQFLTVNNDRNVVVRNHYDLNVYGDITRKIGHLNKYYDIYKQIIDKIKPTHDDIARFEIKRSEKSTRGSQGQTKSGSPAPCPVCTPGEIYKTRIMTPDLFDLNGMVLSETDPGEETSPILTKGISKVVESTFGTGGFIFGSKCLTCDGTGKSPSSQNGKWEKDAAKENAAKKMVDQISELADLEAQLGPGGSEILTVAKDYVVTVGLHMNDMAAVRTDPKGKILANGIKIAKAGVYREQSEAPVMEVVPPHPAFPGGNFDFTVMNRYNVMTGSGGIFFKTKGVVQLAGTLTNLNGDQILVTSVNETRIVGGKSVNIEAENIRLAPDGAAQVLMDGGLAVARNAIIAGGLHVEGEVSLHHITAPVEYQLTEMEEPGGTLKDGKVIGITADDVLVYARDGVTEADCVIVDAHKHYFKNLPLTLMETSNDVREKSIAKNNPAPHIAEKKYTAGNTKYV